MCSQFQPIRHSTVVGEDIWLDFSPIAWLIGIPWAESAIAGSLLGTKLVLNELVAFIQLAEVALIIRTFNVK